MIKFNKREDITLDYLNECFIYDNGRLIWKDRPENHFSTRQGWSIFHNRYAGNEAGTLSNNKNARRCLIRLCSFPFWRSRLVWAIHNNCEWPQVIDHVNRNQLDDRIENLRIATRSQNAQNQSLLASNNSGLKGVYWNKTIRKWHAQIRVNGKRIHVGCYLSPEEAHAAYMSVARKYCGEFATDGVQP